jgi:hypothetical protein
MNASAVALSGSQPSQLRVTPIKATKARVSAFNVSEQTGTLTFARAGATGVDAKANISDVGLSSATNKLTLTLTLQANRKYSFSFFFQTNGPKVTLTDSKGKATAVTMSKGFTVAKTGTYTLTFAAGYSLKDAANFDNLAINAKSVLPTSTGDKNVDALLMGGTDQWWHAYDAAPTLGTDKISASALGLDANSSATALTYSFLTSQPGGQNMTGFQEMTDAQKNAVRAAFAYYAKLINVTFTEVGGDGTGNINFGTNTQASSAGYANLPDASGVKDKVYLYLANNQATNGDAGMAEGGYGWMTALHEIGHTLGLKHPGNYNAGGGGTPGPYLPTALDNRQTTIMSYHDNDVSRGVNATTPMLYDVAALQYLYGANQSGSTASGGAFTFTNGSNYLQTLWSASGSDTIDLSGLTNASKVNLNAGTYSSINITAPAATKSYSGNNNVALAFGSKINNVTLSSANDVADSVTLNGAFSSGGFDTIASFDASADKIVLKKSLFGTLTSANVVVGTAATTAKTKIIVNNATGDIYYDADGSGTKSVAKKIAHYTAIGGGGAISAGNFSFVA